MHLNVEELLATIREELESGVEERYGGYRARLAETIYRLFLAEQAWKVNRTFPNREFETECRATGDDLAAADGAS